jgi:hypothetical protein
VLRRIFGPKGDGVTGGWRKLHNEELHNLYSSPSTINRIIKSSRIRWAEHVARTGEKRNACRILVGKPEGKRPLGRPRRRWVDNIKMDLREIGWVGMDCSDMALDMDQWRTFREHDNKPSDSIKCWEDLEYLYNLRLLKKGSAP